MPWPSLAPVASPSSPSRACVAPPSARRIVSRRPLLPTKAAPEHHLAPFPILPSPILQSSNRVALCSPPLLISPHAAPLLAAPPGPPCSPAPPPPLPPPWHRPPPRLPLPAHRVPFSAECHGRAHSAVPAIPGPFFHFSSRHSVSPSHLLVSPQLIVVSIAGAHRHLHLHHDRPKPPPEPPFLNHEPLARFPSPGASPRLLCPSPTSP